MKPVHNIIDDLIDMDAESLLDEIDYKGRWLVCIGKVRVK